MPVVRCNHLFLDGDIDFERLHCVAPFEGKDKRVGAPLELAPTRFAHACCGLSVEKLRGFRTQ
jgi:hypothetical protein